jgi:hypothetical protein
MSAMEGGGLESILPDGLDCRWIKGAGCFAGFPAGEVFSY